MVNSVISKGFGGRMTLHSDAILFIRVFVHWEGVRKG